MPGESFAYNELSKYPSKYRQTRQDVVEQDVVEHHHFSRY